MTYEDRFLSRDDLEQLLAGAAFDDPRLSGLISAATGPAQPDELVGLDAALAAFGGAVATQARAPGSRSTGTRATGTRATGNRATKLLAGAVAAAAVGGLALAAGTSQLGARPTAHHGAATHGPADASTSLLNGPTLITPAGPTTTAARPVLPQSAPTRPITSDPARTPALGASTKAVKSGPPSPAFTGLCRMWQAQSRHDKADKRNKAAVHPDHSAFAALIKAAGGAPAVDRYCETVLRDAALRPGPTATPQPQPQPQRAYPGHSRPTQAHQPGHPR